MRRNLGRHADGDPGSAVKQHHRQTRRKQLRLFLAAIVVGNEVDGAFVQFVEQHAREWRQARLGITHRGRSEEHTSELQSLMRISYAVFCLKKKRIHKVSSTTTRAYTQYKH